MTKVEHHLGRSLHPFHDASDPHNAAWRTATVAAPGFHHVNNPTDYAEYFVWDVSLTGVAVFLPGT